MADPNNSEITHALDSVKAQIRDAETRFDREPLSVNLLAVSKTKPLHAIHAAIEAGQLEFGENYLDEAVSKILTLSEEYPELSARCAWHYIGAIQSNKTKLIAKHFDWVHSIDRVKIANRLNEQRKDSQASLNCCIQLKLDDEVAKAGISHEGLLPLCQAIADAPKLILRGIMVIPAPRHSFDEQRAAFRAVREVFEEAQSAYPSLDTLSMGMSSDLDAAIAEGSTMVRVGTALFGARQ